MTFRSVRVATVALILAAIPLLAVCPACAQAACGVGDAGGVGGFELRHVEIAVSDCGGVCWFSAVLGSDFGRDGRTTLFHDVRVSGLLERRSGDWVVVRLYLLLNTDVRTPRCGRPAY